MLAGVNYKVGERYGFEQVLVIVDGDSITIADLDGETLIEHTRPTPGITYVGNGKPPGRMQVQKRRNVTEVLRQDTERPDRPRLAIQHVFCISA